MNEHKTILRFRQLEKINDPLTGIAREGARRMLGKMLAKMLAKMLKAEADAFLATHAGERLEDGRQRIVRHGFGPERQIQTGLGALDVQRPGVRDRLASSDPAAKVRFTSNILPKRARRSVSLNALLPVLYLKGEGDRLPDARTGVRAFLYTNGSHAFTSGGAGSHSGGRCAEPVAQHSAAADRRLAEYDAWLTLNTWTRRNLSARNYVHIRADGVYVQARMEKTLNVCWGHRHDAGGQERHAGLPDRPSGKRRTGTSCQRTSKAAGWPSPRKLLLGTVPWGFGLPSALLHKSREGFILLIQYGSWTA